MNNGPNRFSIEFSGNAERDLARLPSVVVEGILKEIRVRLSVNPFLEVKTRIKRLTGFIPPLYRLRIGDYRAYYRIIETRVVVLGVLHKKDTDRWLKRRR